MRSLDQPLNLDSVAEAAGFSPFHFHRIFKTLVGESINDFVKRLRLERSVVLLTRVNWTANTEQTLTEIAFACGFASSADFSRCFKQRFGVPPSKFDVESFRATRRKDWQSLTPDPEQQNLLAPLPVGENPDGFKVRLRDIPIRTVAYLRVPDPYREHVVFDAAAKMVQWAESHGIADGQWLGYMWDDPDVVAHQRCRYDVGLVVGERFEPAFDEGCEIGWYDFPAMQVAEVEVRGPIDLESRAIDWLFRTWLPSSGYRPSDQPSFEAWIGRPFAHGIEYFELFVQIPVTRF